MDVNKALLALIIVLVLVLCVTVAFIPKKVDTKSIEIDLLNDELKLFSMEQSRQFNLYPSNAYCPHRAPGTAASGTCLNPNALVLVGAKGFLLTYPSLTNSTIYIKDSSTLSFAANSEFDFDTAENFIKGTQSIVGDSFTVTINNLTAVTIQVYPFSSVAMPVVSGGILSLRLIVTGKASEYASAFTVSVAKLI